MTKRTLTAIDPNGVAHTRTTARTYTHAVLIRETKAQQITKLTEAVARYRHLVEVCEATLAARYALSLDEAVEVLEEVSLSGGTIYGAVAWCGRHDLAVKEQNRLHNQMATISYYGGNFHTEIVPVNA